MNAVSVVRRLGERHLWTGIGLLALFTTARLAALGGWDEGFYLAQLVSPVAEGDLLLQDDLLALPQQGLVERVRSVTTVLESGAVQNTFSVGFAVIHAGYAWPFIASSGSLIGLRRLLAIGSLAVLVLTALAMVRLCERWGFSPVASRMATGLALASGPLALYGPRLYLNSHLLSALLAAFLLLGILRWTEAGLLRDALFSGLCAGLLVVNRWQDGLLLLALAPLLAGSILRDGTRRLTSAPLLLAAAGFATVALLQLLAWHAQFSRWLFVPQGSGYMNWWSPALIPFVFSPFHGALPWAPGLVLGMALALFCAPREEATAVRRLRTGLMAALPLFLYFSAAPRDWWGGDSYGPRRLATLTPVAALGLAALVERLGPRLRVVLAGALVLWASITVSAYLSGFDDLWVLLRGAPGAFNPRSASAYEGIRWIDPWGPFHALKPGFTFSDKPRTLDRLAGALACTVVVALVVWGWNRLRRSDHMQRVALGAFAAWIAVCAGWLVFVIPSNEDWNKRWRAVLEGKTEPVAARPFPPGVSDAAQLIRALQALRSGDEAAFREHWSVAQANGAFGIREGAMRDLVRDAPPRIDAPPPPAPRQP